MKTVFVVDDDVLMLELLRRTLEREGFRVKAFHSPVAASEAFKRERPDLVISDVNMPEMTGFELVELIATRPGSVPVLMITGEPQDDYESRAERLGVRLMRKPVRDLSPLVTWVREAAAQGDEDLDRVRFDFLISISHELRTPLTALKLAFDTLELDDGDASERAMVLDIGRRNIDRLARQVDGQLRLLEYLIQCDRASTDTVTLNDAFAELQDRPELNGTGGTQVVTDIDRLQAVMGYLAELQRAGGGATNIAVEVIDAQHAVLTFENTRFGHSIGLMDSSAGETPRASLWNPSTGDRSSFEEQACERIIASAGGRLRVEEDAVRIELPLAVGATAN